MECLSGKKIRGEKETHRCSLHRPIVEVLEILDVRDHIVLILRILQAKQKHFAFCLLAVWSRVIAYALAKGLQTSGLFATDVCNKSSGDAVASVLFDLHRNRVPASTGGLQD